MWSSLCESAERYVDRLELGINVIYDLNIERSPSYLLLMLQQTTSSILQGNSVIGWLRWSWWKGFPNPGEAHGSVCRMAAGSWKMGGEDEAGILMEFWPTNYLPRPSGSKHFLGPLKGLEVQFCLFVCFWQLRTTIRSLFVSGGGLHVMIVFVWCDLITSPPPFSPKWTVFP